MADISQIKTPNGNTYNIKDETARNSISGLAPKASPTFTGVPTAPTASAETNDTQIATTAFVHSVMSANDAMTFKGTIGTGGTVTALPTTHKKGWTYKVITAGTYAGKTCEVGDMIICVSDGTAAADADWTVVQSNIDGAVTGPASSVDARVAVFNGTSGKVIKDSGFTIGKSVPSNAVFTDNDTKNTAGSTDTSSKIFLIGATSQAANPQTYSQDTAYVGTDGCLYSGGVKVLTSHQSIAGKKNTQTAVTDPTADGNSLTFIDTISQDAQGVITPTKKTVTDMTGASSSAAGTHGLVPAPAKGNQAKFLRGDGSWQTALTSHQDISGKKNTQSAVSDPTASGTSLTFIATISQDAQGVITPAKKTVATMTKATSSAAGTGGLVPVPAAGKQSSFLRGDATWATPSNTKNTAGATDSSSKLFLVGATEQTANPQTYSQDTAYVGTDGCLYSNSKKVVTDVTFSLDESTGVLTISVG